MRILGRKKVVGKPVLYGTTRDFLTHFGLNSLADLPSMEEFGEMASAVIPAAPEPEESPSTFEEDGNGRPGDDGEFEDESEEESERQDDGDDS